MKVTELVDFGKKCWDLFEKYISEENIRPRKRIYMRHFLTELEISEKSHSATGSAEIVEEDDWSLIIFEFLREKISSMPEFKGLNQTIAKHYKNNIIKMVGTHANVMNQPTVWLDNFIQRIIYEKLEGKFSNDMLLEYAVLFKSELDLVPTEYNYSHFLMGIVLEPDSIQISDNIRIRKVQKKDFEYKREIFLDLPNPPHIRRTILPPSVLKIDQVFADEIQAEILKERLINSLRLYKLGSVYSLGSIHTRNTIIWPKGSRRLYGRERYRENMQYYVNNSEIKVFIDFINTMEKKLTFDKGNKKFRNLYISIERYNFALLESVDTDGRLMNAVMGLESLYTFESERGENAYKLGIRVAKLLGHLKYKAEKVRISIQAAYNFRNKVVHGSYVSLNEKRKINELLPLILDYLRVSLIIFLFNRKMGKNKIVELIDKATIEKNDDEKLKEICDKCIKNYEMVICPEKINN